MLKCLFTFNTERCQVGEGLLSHPFSVWYTSLRENLQLESLKTSTENIQVPRLIYCSTMPLQDGCISSRHMKCPKANQGVNNSCFGCWCFFLPCLMLFDSLPFKILWVILPTETSLTTNSCIYKCEESPFAFCLTIHIAKWKRTLVNAQIYSQLPLLTQDMNQSKIAVVFLLA